jgi:FHA domain
VVGNECTRRWTDRCGAGLRHLPRNDRREAFSVNAQTVVDRGQKHLTSTSLSLTVLHHGTPTGLEFSVLADAIVGRFHPTSGPVEVDLGDVQGGDRVSRRHALLYVENLIWCVRDLQSTNGLFVRQNDGSTIRVFRSTTLEHGMQVSFGPVTLGVSIITEDPRRSAHHGETVG